MNPTRLLTIAILTGGLALASCGDDDGAALPGGDASANAGGDLAMAMNDLTGVADDGPRPDMPCTGLPGGDCSACLKANCDQQLSACFGASWQTTNAPNSVCAGVYACSCTCMEKGGMDCLKGCAPQSTAGCPACLQTALECSMMKCAVPCK